MGSGQDRDSRGDAANQVPSQNDGEETRPGIDAADFDAMDTTSWSGSAPPVLIDEDETTLLAVPVSAAVVGGGAAATAESAASGSLEEGETLIAEPTESVTTPRTMAPSSALPPMLLERMDPSMGRGERIRLDVRHWNVRLGRAEENEVRLYTASASREHARIAGNEEGQWILTPAEGKSVFVDGEAISEPIELEVGMNLVLGRDHLRCVIEGLDRRDSASRTATEAFEGADRDWMSKLAALGPLGMGSLLVGVVVVIALFRWLGA